MTANCGNSGLGKKATNKIAQEIKEGNPSLDFCVLNCQENHYSKTMSELKNVMGSSPTSPQNESGQDETKDTFNPINQK